MQQTQPSKIRVLIGDSSVRSRLVLSGMIDAEPRLEVVDTARSQEELLHKAFTYKPDLIVTHYGLTMSGRVPFFKPVYGEKFSLLLMVSQQLAEHTYTISTSCDINGKQVKASEGTQVSAREKAKEGLMAKLRELLGQDFTSSPASVQTKWKEAVELRQRNNHLLVKMAPPVKSPLAMVVIGASTGGSAAIEYLIRDLDVQQPAVVLVAVHMPERFTRRLARRLQRLTHWRVEEGYEGMPLSAGTVVIAPGGQNMRVKSRSLQPNQYFLELEPSAAMDSPSVDILMHSAAQSAQTQVLGIIMTGMGQDGTMGAREIVDRGGIVIAQNEETSTIFGMAKSAIESGVVSGVFPLGQINSIISRFVANRSMSHVLQQKLVG
ncbi:chemotaxis protein CheB [Rufibacter roseolus]|uniref:chemotaxis protein CheB n=1 Tax=Rufibacter roseolus TaxID=2817375 RepID=UPI001B303EB2|nr:chemotaxis protein CheB [Rufibacter roseolus]